MISTIGQFRWERYENVHPEFDRCVSYWQYLNVHLIVKQINWCNIRPNYHGLIQVDTITQSMACSQWKRIVPYCTFRPIFLWAFWYVRDVEKPLSSIDYFQGVTYISRSQMTNPRSADRYIGWQITRWMVIFFQWPSLILKSQTNAKYDTPSTK